MSASSAPRDDAASSSSSDDMSCSAYAVYDRCLTSDAHTLVEQVNRFLPLAFLYRDSDRVSLYLRRLLALMDLKRPEVTTRAVRGEWVRMLTENLLKQGEQLPMHVQIKM